MSFICEYCDKSFSNKSNLNNHILKAKYCLNKRKENKNINYNCIGCYKKFTSKQSLEYHNTICINIKLSNKDSQIKEQKEFYESHLKEQKEFYEIIIKEKQEQIKELQNEIIIIAKSLKL